MADIEADQLETTEATETVETTDASEMDLLKAEVDKW